MSGLSEIVSLAALITDAVQTVVHEYTIANAELPSLSSTATGPFDSPETSTEALVRAIRIIEAACAQLSATVAPPNHTVLNKSYGLEEPICMLVVTEAQIADHLLDQPQGLHVDVLGQKTGIDSGKLGRILRLLATNHCFSEVKANIFANNRLSMKLVSSEPIAAKVGHLTDEIGRACVASLNENLRDPDTTSSSTPQGSAFVRTHGCTVFDYYSRPEQKMRSDRFNRAMIAWGNATGKGMLPQIYPWESLQKDTVICDVGGGNGHASINLLKAFPHLKIIVQDLPGVVTQGREYLESEDLDLDSQLKQRVEFIPLDFLQESPVSSCDIYYIRHVLHDWPAAECKKILDNIRKVVKPTSRVFIHELVLQHIVPDGISDGQFEMAPQPLLPNFGVGRFRLYAQDINMMTALNSQERTLPQFIEFGAQSGFKFVKLHHRAEAGLMEFVPTAPE